MVIYTCINIIGRFHDIITNKALYSKLTYSLALWSIGDLLAMVTTG